MLQMSDVQLYKQSLWGQCALYGALMLCCVEKPDFIEAHSEMVLHVHVLASWTIKISEAFCLSARQHGMNCCASALFLAALCRPPTCSLNQMLLTLYVLMTTLLSRKLAYTTSMSEDVVLISFMILGIFGGHIRQQNGSLDSVTRSLCSQQDASKKHPNLCASSHMETGSRVKPKRSQKSLDGVVKDRSMPMPPSPFDQVSLFERIGGGSFSQVYAGSWNGVKVAVKIITSSRDKGSMQRQDSEGALSAELSHPNLVQTFLWDSQSDMATLTYETWIVQEFCDAGTLRTLLLEDTGAAIREHTGAPATRNILEILVDIASACRYLHSRDVIHGDLYDMNVLIQKCTRNVAGFITKVSDFGLSKVLDRNANEHHTRSLGCVTHMPPEMFYSFMPALTKKVDVYSYGILLWQLLTCSLPYPGLSAPQICLQKNKGKRPELPLALKSCEELEELSSLYESCTCTDFSQRPSSERVSSIVRQLLEDDFS
eukprot:TRINITY_DN15104_c0_g1_i5.p1 TRINITY_DN15104_c0_g1~~TRINITY_DN15104_c0_g1_i5.p1  ORF type:complete len:542 (-),score=75.57 TRINITY_DN15104_c0_g1_i5:215-1669(-)